MDVPSSSKARTQKYLSYIPYLGIGVIFIAVLMFLPGLLGNALPSVDASDVLVSEVIQGDFTRNIRGVGKLISERDRWVTAETDGFVEAVLAKPGDTVEPNTLLVKLSNPLLEREFLQSQSDLKVSEAKLEALRAKLADERLQHDFAITEARLNYESAKAIEQPYNELLASEVVAKLDFIKVQQETKVANALLKVLEERTPYLELSHGAQLDSEAALVEQLSFKMQNFKHQIDQLTVLAGISGVLQEVGLEEGERAEVGTNIARVSRTGPLLGQLEVQEVQARDISIGLSVEIDTRSGRAQGEVIRIDPRVRNGSVQVDVAFTTELPKGARPDQSITGTIQVENIANTLYMNRPSFVSAQRQVSLFVLNSQGTHAQQRQIGLGRTSVSHVEVLSGVKAGDRVIVSDFSDYRQYQKIKIN